MKNIIYIMLSIAMLGACTDTNERETSNYTVRINNSSSKPVILEGYDNQNNLEFMHQIGAMSLGGQCTYNGELFGGYICGADSLVFKFPNGKGYICDLRQSGNNLCFDTNFIFGNEDDFSNVSNNLFEFMITQEDVDNAFDLP